MTKTSAQYQHLTLGQRSLIRKKVANAAPEGRSILIRRLARHYGVRGATIAAIHSDGPRQSPYAVKVERLTKSPGAKVFEKLRRNAALSEATARRRRAEARR